MNLFQLEYFITLADTLSYTKASEKLHITQPTLSRMIINLEHEIGSQLFERNKRDVKLTSAGKFFYTEMKKTVHSYNAAVKSLHDVAEGTTGIINLGFLGTTMIIMLPKIINKFHEEYPAIKINPFDYSYSRMMEALADGELDITILADMNFKPNPKFIKKSIFTDMMCIVVNKDHKFASLTSIDFSLFKDEPFINMNPKASYCDYDFINKIFAQHNSAPNMVYEASSLFNMLVMVDCKLGITILASHMEQFASNSVKFIPINGLETAFNVICVYKDAENSNIEKLLSTISRCLPQGI